MDDPRIGQVVDVQGERFFITAAIDGWLMLENEKNMFIASDNGGDPADAPVARLMAQKKERRKASN